MIIIPFNAVWYLNQNPDVAAAVQAGIIDAETHFELYGRYEGRSASSAFDAQAYLSANPDVAAAFAVGQITPWDHFEQFGSAEGRSPTPLFNEALYLQQNPDVAAAVASGAFESAAQHFVQHGLTENRIFNHAIDLNKYLDANPDLAQAVANGQINPLDHLLQHGLTEGRDLGNGISLTLFANDPVFKQAINGGDLTQALVRVANVAPFVPTFERPTGWAPSSETPIPTGFVLPTDSNITLVIPSEVNVPAGVVLPSTFDPVTPTVPVTPGGGVGGGVTPTFTVTNSVTVDAANKKATIDFTDTVLNNTADLTALKGAIKVSTNGTDFSALSASDTVDIVSGNVVVTFNTLPTSNTLKIQVAAAT